MARRDYLTDEQVEKEIERLMDSDLVKLAKKEEYVRNQGRELSESGITMEVLDSMLKGCGSDGV